MPVEIHIQTEQLALDAARKLISWSEASRQGHAENCRQLEAEFFSLVEENGLSQEWLELFSQQVAFHQEIESPIKLEDS